MGDDEAAAPLMDNPAIDTLEKKMAGLEVSSAPVTIQIGEGGPVVTVFGADGSGPIRVDGELPRPVLERVRLALLNEASEGCGPALVDRLHQVAYSVVREDAPVDHCLIPSGARRAPNEFTVPIVDVDSYVFKKLIASGAFGAVYRCEEKATDRIVAIKRFVCKNKTLNQDVIRELAVLTRLRGHPYVVELLGMTLNDSTVKMVMTYYRRTLHDVKFRGNLDRIRRVCYQVLSVAAFLADQHVVHRDWKPANLLWDDSDDTIRVVDFGQCRVLSEKMWHKHIFTLDYRPPEISMGCNDYGSATDVWAISQIFYFMVLRRPLFDTDEDDDDEALMKMILTEFGVPTKREWPSFTQLPRYTAYSSMIESVAKKKKESTLLTSILKGQRKTKKEWKALGSLLSDMMQLCPEKRPSAKECLNHPFFAITRSELTSETDDDDDENDPQLAYMKQARKYQHHLPFVVDSSMSSMADADPSWLELRRNAITEIFCTAQTSYPILPSIYLDGIHILDTFLRNLWGKYKKFPSGKYWKEVALAAIFIAYKLHEDFYFDIKDEFSGNDEDDDDILSIEVEEEGEEELPESESAKGDDDDDDTEDDGEDEEDEEEEEDE
eukprot:Sspe_Gene.71126::Locus_42104_Transcript_1_1_Confidence_1.000_Length_1941::g.71126::m.71126